MHAKIMGIGLAVIAVSGASLPACAATISMSETAMPVMRTPADNSVEVKLALSSPTFSATEPGIDLSGNNRSATPVSPVKTVTVTVKPGDTFSEILSHQGIDQDQIAEAIKAVSGVYDLRRLQIGDRLILSVARPRHHQAQLLGVHLKTATHQHLTILSNRRDGLPAPAKQASRPQVRKVTATVRSSLAAALAKSGVPAPVAHDVVIAAQLDSGFPAKPPRGANVTVVYEAAQPKQAHTSPTLRFATVRAHGREHNIYRYELSNGRKALLTESGKGIAEAQLANPVPRAEISSGWGWRIHPVLGVRKFHRGIDLAAATGTPVHAAADGVIEDIGWRGNYGRYIRVEHSSRCATAYAHLSRFAAGLHDGSTVKRGEIIGYVGQSGLATGPHLYYEVLIDNHQTNPTLAELVSPVHLQGEDLEQFKAFVEDEREQSATKQASLPD